MERHKPIPQPFFPCCIRTPKTHRCLNTLHPNPRDEFRTCWGRVEELLVAGELWINHKKLIFFPRSSATTCTNCPLEADQRSSWWLGSCGSTTRSSSSSPVRLLRPAQTVHLKPIKEQPYVEVGKVWSAIQSTVLSLSESGADPVNAATR
ncbi:hypothetical protein Taro_011435 [Colocasia esculenta]|uniref:Uncharacterized protein n=1 Tax=Colocasia esculenta TaxID=4460 RepID=A0A843U680_COLES|nr:hypothetical protein [Colocasia esculenta]